MSVKNAAFCDRTLFFILGVYLVNFVQAQDVTFSSEPSTCQTTGNDLIWVVKYTGAKTVSRINWYFHKQQSGDIVVLTSLSPCNVFGAPDDGYPHDRMTYSCDSSTNTYKTTIRELDGTEEGKWGVFLTFSDLTISTQENKNLTFCTPGTTTTITTSTSTTTTTTLPPPTTTTIPSTTTTTSTVTTTTTPTTTTTKTTSTITTTPMPTTRTITTTTPSTTARPTTQSPTTTPSTSTSVTPSKTTPSNTRGESNTSLIAMIVVVSVIGGILVIAIVFMILVMVYGKSGLPLITHRKGTHHRPPFHHHHHRHHKHHKRRERSEHSFYQPQNVLAGYSFYRGGVENPVFQESMNYPNSSDLHYKDANEGLHALRYDEQPPEYQYAVNWEYDVD